MPGPGDAPAYGDGLSGFGRDRNSGPTTYRMGDWRAPLKPTTSGLL